MRAQVEFSKEKSTPDLLYLQWNLEFRRLTILGQLERNLWISDNEKRQTIVRAGFRRFYREGGSGRQRDEILLEFKRTHCTVSNDQ